MSRLNQKFDWKCPVCQHENTNDLYTNETEQPMCSNCNRQCDVFLDVEIRVIKVVSQDFE